MIRTLTPPALGAALVLLAGCGGGGGGTRQAIVRCAGTPLASAPELPTGFPKLDEVTYVRAEQRGPTVVVDGFYEGGLGDAYDAYRNEFEAAGYTILFDEREAFDAEVAYRDAAGAVSGQVALRDRCKEAGRVALHITARPA